MATDGKTIHTLRFPHRCLSMDTIFTSRNDTVIVDADNSSKRVIIDSILSGLTHALIFHPSASGHICLLLFGHRIAACCIITLHCRLMRNSSVDNMTAAARDNSSRASQNNCK